MKNSNPSNQALQKTWALDQHVLRAFCKIFSGTPRWPKYADKHAKYGQICIFGRTKYGGCPWKDLAKCSSRVGLRSIGPSSQKLWPNWILGRFPHCNYNLKLQVGGNATFLGLWIWKESWRLILPNQTHMLKIEAEIPQKKFLHQPSTYSIFNPKLSFKSWVSTSEKSCSSCLYWGEGGWR